MGILQNKCTKLAISLRAKITATRLAVLNFTYTHSKTKNNTEVCTWHADCIDDHTCT